jgi:hypothetical protein
MSHTLRRLLHWSEPILRLLIWSVALGYLLLEAREVAAQRQLTQITVFAVLFLVASFQLSLARFLVTGPEAAEAAIALQSSLAMFVASLFSVLDGALDHLFAALQGGGPGPAAPLLYLLGWVVNLLCVVMALASLELFLALLRRLIPRI